jgi:hypothetical protein
MEMLILRQFIQDVLLTVRIRFWNATQISEQTKFSSRSAGSEIKSYFFTVNSVEAISVASRCGW